MLREGIALLKSHDGAIPVEPLPDTIKRVSEREIVQETIDRAQLRAAQTPQVFRAQSLRRAHAEAQRAARIGTDDASLLEAESMTVATFPGHWSNFKITTERDLVLARLLLDHPNMLEP